MGRITYSVDLFQAPTFTNGHLGVAYLNGELFTTTRGVNGAPPHLINVWDSNGNWLRSFQQPASTATSLWGFRDGGSDGVSLIFGHEGGIEVIDAFGNPVNQLIADNGPQPIVQPIVVVAGAVGMWRAIAFDPSGNGGNGSMFLGNFSAAVVEVALDGSVLHTFPTPSPAWYAFGLALDTGSNTLWIAAKVNAGPIAEYQIDRANNQLVPTGREIERGVVGSTQGGLEFVPGGLDGRGCGSDLVAIDQETLSTPDMMFGYRLDLYDGFASSLEPTLQAGYDGANFGKQVSVPSTASSIEWLAVGGLPGVPAILVVDANLTTPLPPGITGLPELWELQSFGLVQATILDGTPFSIPAAGLIGAGPGFSYDAQAVMLTQGMPVGSCGLSIPIMTTNPVRHGV